MRKATKTNPPGRRKIIRALSELMTTKDFHSITTAEIAKTAGVTEGLIYKYFAAKKDLLYEVLHLHFSAFNSDIEEKIKGQDTAIEKLATFIQTSIESYSTNRVFAKILLLEVRNSPSYFESNAYQMVKVYAATLLAIIEEGIEQGELNKDTDAGMLRKMVFGVIEHSCLGEIIFGRELDVSGTAATITTLLLQGVKTDERK